MIQASDISAYVAQYLEGTSYFLVGVDEPEADTFAVLVDSAAPVDIDFCAALSRAIRDNFGTDLDEYNLEVGSAGITAPFRVRGQYIKNLGKEIEVLTNAGRKLRGELSAVDADTFTIDVKVKRRLEDVKKPVEVTEQTVIPFADVKSAKLILKF